MLIMLMLIISSVIFILLYIWQNYRCFGDFLGPIVTPIINCISGHICWMNAGLFPQLWLVIEPTLITGWSCRMKQNQLGFITICCSKKVSQKHGSQRPSRRRMWTVLERAAEFQPTIIVKAMSWNHCDHHFGWRWAGNLKCKNFT